MYNLSHTHTHAHAHTRLYRYGEIVNVNLVRDKTSGKPKGFCFLAYEDQRSSVLAVDNLNGFKVQFTAFTCTRDSTYISMYMYSIVICVLMYNVRVHELPCSQQDSSAILSLLDIQLLLCGDVHVHASQFDVAGVSTHSAPS